MNDHRKTNDAVHRLKRALRIALAVPLLMVAGIAGLMLPAKNYPLWAANPDFYMKLKMWEFAAFLVCGLLAWVLWPDEENNQVEPRHD